MGYTPPQINPGHDTVWIALNTFLIFFMQLGFTMVEAGSVRIKNIHSILMKNTIDICIITVGWWTCGYSFAYGQSNGGIVGSTRELFFGIDLDKYNSYLHFMFTWSYSCTACTIVSGCVAERLTIRGYFILCTVMSIFIYPITTHWINGGGWLTDSKFHDFAGACQVHMVGGSVGLIATVVLKPRIGRFDQGEQNKFKPNSVPFVVLGTLLLWFCWYGFNCGTLRDIEKQVDLVGKIGLNTTVAGVSGSIACYITTMIVEPRIQNDLITLNICMGALTGLVSITGCAEVVEPWAAFLIGLVGGAFFIGYQKIFLVRLQIDDPLDATTIHFGGGLWGCIATGIFMKEKGLIYGGVQIITQILGAFATMVWTMALSFITMKIIKDRGIMRISVEDELMGMDNINNDHYGETYQLKMILDGIEVLKQTVENLNKNEEKQQIEEEEKQKDKLQ